LRAKRHLLILDNLESITGTQLAIQHTLPPEEQTALRRLLADQVGGRTLVLLGSRSGEEWLSPETFGDNVYDLPGLDPEAASTLADRILERNRVTKYRKDPDFQQLLTLLDGFPLALEVVLANLARQIPKEVLSALQAGDVSLKTGDSQEKTKNIVRCIDYSHSNLSPEAQQLLLCLAPFTSVLWQDQLENYTTYLRQQPLLAKLPFERWPEVVQEATNWGLLSPDPDIPSFLRLQPTMPYFLRSRLQAPGQAEVRGAVETAFRELYDRLSAGMYDLFQSNEPQKRQVGQLLTGLEYENLVTALDLALAAQVSIQYPYFALSRYLDTIQDQPRGLQLAEKVLDRLETYPADKLADKLGFEFVYIIGDIGRRQLLLKHYTEAERSFQKLLQLVNQLEQLDEKECSRLKAGSYHNLGIVAQEQRQFTQAQQYYQQALQLHIEFNDRYEQARTYFGLGAVADERQQWSQAQHYYQQALQLYIEFNDRYEQARTYHQLGMVAQEQRQFTQAQQYYQQALQIFIEFNDRYEQADTYHNLGIVAQEQRQWAQAREYFLQALEIYVSYQDTYTGSIALRSLAQLWQASGDASLPVAIASIVGITPAEVEEFLRRSLEDKPDQSRS
jgi:tetratricopeptide (TPR) repeat protein